MTEAITLKWRLTVADELDILMSRYPLDEGNKPMPVRELDAIIAYYRNRRAAASAPGGRAKIKKETGPKQSIDLGELGIKKPTGPILPMRKL